MRIRIEGHESNSPQINTLISLIVLRSSPQRCGAISEIRVVLFFSGLKDEIRNFLLQFKSTNRGSSWQSIPASWVYSSQRYIANHYTVPQWIELAELARRNNFDQVWVNDNLGYRNVFVILTAIASRCRSSSGQRSSSPTSGTRSMQQMRSRPSRSSSMDMRKLCHSSDASPLGIPLHPGAKQYY